ARLNGEFAPSRYEFLPDDLELYMEYRPGRTLDVYLEQWTSKMAFPPDEVLLRLAQSVVEAVQSCHRTGVIVADLKPRNIQIGRGEAARPFSVTLLDFGSAWLIGSPNPRPSADYSPGFGAPELLRGESPTPASDLYSVGAILFALFARREPSLHLPPRDFGNRQSLVLPALQDLVMHLTEDEPADRPTVEEALTALRACADDVADLARAAGAHCPRCQQPVPEVSARFCRHCGAPLTRETRVLSEERGASDRADPLGRMAECERAGDYVSALFWAKHAFQTNRLPPRDRVVALEIALRVFGELDFASKLASSLSAEELPNESDQRKYLVCLGQLLAGLDRFRPNQNQFAQYREQFERAVEKWPEQEFLWCWLYLASDPAQQEKILQSGLTHHPDSARIRLYLGRVQLQRGARHEALSTWVDAVQNGEREPRFLQAVYKLAQELADQTRTEVLREVILSGQPQTPQEALDLARFAAQEGRTAKALEAVEQGLSQDPHNPDLRRCKAEILYAQRKYELVLDLDWVKTAGDDAFLRILKGRCFYELGRAAEAAQEMAAVITRGEGTAETWFILVRCYQRLGKSDYARKALDQALRAFPDDEGLRRLAGARR
ncbi:MAG TPA: tetratricopeptide repeat protein, partial [Terriglobia bacterium]|nr:tetratricopeptide repeat protein [Terriglobia bacterium]